MRYLKKIIMLACFFAPSAFAAINPCQFFHTNENAVFVGNNGTLSQLQGVFLFIGPNSSAPNETSFFGALGYYQGDFFSNATGTCISNGDGTANVLMNTSILGSFAGTLVMTSLGPILHITSSSLSNNQGGYSNVTGYLALGPNPNGKSK